MAGLLGYALSLVSPYLFSTSRHHVHRLSNNLEPFLRHKVLNPLDFQEKDLLIIGDVHGCYDELQQLLKEAEQKTKKPFLKVFVGDMINKGPQSEAVLDYIMHGKDNHCVRGNHEQKVLHEYFAYKDQQASPNDKRLWVKNLNKSYVDYVKSLPYTIAIPSLNIIVVHAGLVPGKSLFEQDENCMMNIRNLFWDQDNFHGQILKWTYRCDIGKAWSEQWSGPGHVYFGHDAVRKLQINNHSTGLDTGCVYGGELTAILLRLNSQNTITDKEFIQVSPKKVYVSVID